MPEPTPTRTCVGCRVARSQRSMVRCVLEPTGAVVSRVAPGRGAWVCSVECTRSAITRRAFDRAWRCRVPADCLAGLAERVESALSTDAGDVMREKGRRPAARMEEWPIAGGSPAGRCR